MQSQIPSNIEKTYRTNPDSPICDKVRFARISANLTQDTLAKTLGIDRSTLIRLENRQVSDEHINTDILIKIAEVCGVDKFFCCDGYHTFLLDSVEKIIDFRQKYRLRQHEFAQLMGVTDATVKRWEYGKVKMSKDKYLLFASLLEGYSVSVDEYHEFIIAGPALLIKQFRLEKGLSQDEFAKKLSFARSTVQLWEQNRNMPNKESFKVLSKAFNGEINI